GGNPHRPRATETEPGPEGLRPTRVGHPRPGPWPSLRRPAATAGRGAIAFFAYPDQTSSLPAIPWRTASLRPGRHGANIPGPSNPIERRRPGRRRPGPAGPTARLGPDRIAGPSRRPADPDRAEHRLEGRALRLHRRRAHRPCSDGERPFARPPAADARGPERAP